MERLNKNTPNGSQISMSCIDPQAFQICYASDDKITTVIAGLTCDWKIYVLKRENKVDGSMKLLNNGKVYWPSNKDVLAHVLQTEAMVADENETIICNYHGDDLENVSCADVDTFCSWCGGKLNFVGTEDDDVWHDLEEGDLNAWYGHK